MKAKSTITQIKGIGDKAKQSYQKLGIETVGQLLEHYPVRYDKYEEIVPISELCEGMTAVIEGVLLRLPEQRKIRNLHILNLRISDGNSNVAITFFNMPFLAKQLKLGTKYLLRGKVIRKNGMLSIEQPAILTKEEYYNKKNRLMPVYGLTNGLTNHNISKSLALALNDYEFEKDYLPKSIRDEHGLMEYKKAVKTVHFPATEADMLLARKRIVFDEFFYFTLAIQYLKNAKEYSSNQCVMADDKAVEQLLSSLPYQLTKAQLKVWEEIKNDLSGNKTMNRLVQGDVGSGKTVVAALALLVAAKNGYQATLMVPTEVLGRQHYESLTSLLGPFGVRIGLLTGSITAKEKRIMHEQIKNHEVDVIVGTHALIQDKVEYDKLGLVITDEQHRFGVKQREILSEKGNSPHILVMSATPIPRTLAIILYGDLDISIIDELPANRLPIKNCVVNTGYRATAYKFIEKEVQAGRQAYVICPMVEESEAMEAENVIDYTEKLSEAFQSNICVEYLHGKMKPAEKNDIMERFSKGEIHVLVSTTVIEVGVNVPNSTVMMVENAERFGLAQLHQLRGRVGRGKHQSYCIFVSGSRSKETMQRLEILNGSNDGFKISEEDLKLRGPGDLFGIRQSGMMEFKMADVYNDSKILILASQVAKQYVTDKAIELKNEQFVLDKIANYAKRTLL